MYQPPSTLTSADQASSSSATSTASKTKKKSTTPDLLANDESKPPTSRSATSAQQSGNKGRTSRGPRVSSDRKSLLSTVTEKGSNDPTAYDSDGGQGPATYADSDDEAQAHSPSEKRQKIALGRGTLVGSNVEDVDLSPPPLLPRSGAAARIQVPTQRTQPTFIKGGLVSVSPESASKRSKYGLKGFGGNVGDAWSVFGPSKQDKTKTTDVDLSSPRTAYPWRNLDNLDASPTKRRGDSRQLLGLGPFNNRLGAVSSSLQQEERPEGDGDTDQEDEDDFHQAMLDCDFDIFDSQKIEETSSSWPSSARRSAEAEDTPATTPRSPQSGCDLPTPGSPRYRKDEASVSTSNAISSSSSTDKKESGSSFGSCHDAVFAHALPTTLVGADRPYQHAGSLTLSLPYSPEVGTASPSLQDLDDDVDMDGQDDKAKDFAKQERFTTPIVARRMHFAAAGGKRLEGLAASLKFEPSIEDRASPSTAGPQFLQFTPVMEMESPLLSPTLGLDLPDKASQPPSPLVVGVPAITGLNSPAPVSLPPPASLLDAELPSKEPDRTNASTASAEKASSAEPASAPKAVPESSDAPKTKSEAVRQEPVVTARRAALPPPRHISFTVRNVDPVPTVPGVPQSSLPVLPSPAVANRTPAATSRTTPARTAERTPELVEGSASSWSESSSASASPVSRSDSDAAADAEVESLLFGPPEKLDLQELDQVWGGTNAESKTIELKDTAVATKQVGSTLMGGLGGVPVCTKAPVAAPINAPLRRAKVTKLHHVDLTPN